MRAVLSSVALASKTKFLMQCVLISTTMPLSTFMCILSILSSHFFYLSVFRFFFFALFFLLFNFGNFSLLGDNLASDDPAAINYPRYFKDNSKREIFYKLNLNKACGADIVPKVLLKKLFKNSCPVNLLFCSGPAATTEKFHLKRSSR